MLSHHVISVATIFGCTCSTPSTGVMIVSTFYVGDHCKRLCRDSLYSYSDAYTGIRDHHTFLTYPMVFMEAWAVNNEALRAEWVATDWNVLRVSSVTGYSADYFSGQGLFRLCWNTTSSDVPIMDVLCSNSDGATAMLYAILLVRAACWKSYGHCKKSRRKGKKRTPTIERAVTRKRSW